MRKYIQYKFIFSMLFICLIALPMFAGFIQEDQKVSTTEKRKLEEPPQWKGFKEIKHYFTSLDNYFDDHFGFREFLVKTNSSLRYQLLRESPNKRVVVGTSDWVFYKTHDLLFVSGLKNSEVHKNLNKRIKAIVNRYDFFKDQNIPYLYTVAPNKMSLYSEHLPSVYRFANLDASYHIFKRQLQSARPDLFIDSRKILDSKKENEFGMQVYKKNDTHWNELGAYYIAEELVKTVNDFFPNKNISLASHKFKPKKIVGGDIANMMGMSLTSVEPKTSHINCSKLPQAKRINHLNLTIFNCNKNNVKVLFIGDSFKSIISSFLAESFGEFTMTGQGLTHSKLKKIIHHIKPDIVIEELVQRNITKPL